MTKGVKEARLRPGHEGGPAGRSGRTVRSGDREVAGIEGADIDANQCDLHVGRAVAVGIDLEKPVGGHARLHITGVGESAGTEE